MSVVSRGDCDFDLRVRGGETLQRMADEGAANHCQL